MAGESSLLAGINPIGAGLSLIPSVFQTLKGLSQKKQANKINPIDPGYQMNNKVIDNARILGDRYGNYQMPGFGNAQNQISANSANAFAQGSQGASSSGDVLDLASKIAYGGNQASNQLYQQNAIGKEGALKDYLGANAQAGQQYQDKNAYDREQYMQKLREKAALSQAGDTNIMGALENVGSTGTSIAMSGLGGSQPSTVPRTTGVSANGLGRNVAGASGISIPTQALPATQLGTMQLYGGGGMMTNEDYLQKLRSQIGIN